MDISTEIAAIQAASQGSELRQPLIGALNKLNSGTLPTVTASDIGKILKVGANGWEVGEKTGYMPVPTATKQITENGTHDVTDYASAVVNVSGGGGSVLIPKTITQNGTYDPADDNADGYSSVTVNVHGSSGIPILPSEYQLVEYIESSGTQRIETGLYNRYDNIPVMYSCKILYPDVINRQLNGSQGSYYIGVINGKWQCGEGSTNSTNITVEPNVWYTLQCYYNGYGGINTNVYGGRILTIINNGSPQQIHFNTSTHNNFQPAANMHICLFSLNDQILPSSCRIKEFAIFQNNVLSRHFYPCYRKLDNVIGMYDIINDVFYTNSGTGTFAKGNDMN